MPKLRGPGKYDDICTAVREITHARGVVLMVVGGRIGNGFSVQADEETMHALPGMIEAVVKMFRKDNKTTEMSTHDTLNDSCPFCGKQIDCATNTDDQKTEPTPGDFSLCMDCGEWLTFDDHLKVRKPTDEEYLEIAEDKDMRKIRDCWLQTAGSKDRVLDD